MAVRPTVNKASKAPKKIAVPKLMPITNKV